MAGAKLELSDVEPLPVAVPYEAKADSNAPEAKRRRVGSPANPPDAKAVQLQAIKKALAESQAQLALDLCTKVIDDASSPARKTLVPFYIARSKAKIMLGQTQASLGDAKLAIRADESDPKTYVQAATCFKEAGLEKNCRAALKLARTKLQAAAPSWTSAVTATKLEAKIREIEDGLAAAGIARLPVEVLIRIFIACDGDTFSLIRMEAVCRKWRHILKNATAPWKAVHLWHPQDQFLSTAIAIGDTPGEPAPAHSVGTVRRAMEYAGLRTGKKLTSIQVDLRKGMRATEIKRILQYLKMMDASIHTLKLCVHADDVAEFSLFMGLPALRCFYLSDGAPGISTSTRQVAAGQKVKSKDNVLLGPVAFCAELYGARSVTLQGLEQYPTFPEGLLQDVAHSAATLETFRVASLAEWENRIVLPEAPLLFPRLRAFEASMALSKGPSRIAHYMKAPEVRLLSISSIKHEAIHSFYANFCDVSKLEELSLSFAESTITPESRRSALLFFSELQNLRKLDISADGKTQILDDVITCLTPSHWNKEVSTISSTPIAFLPALSTLIIRKHPTMTGSQLMRSVAARMQPEGSAAASPSQGAGSQTSWPSTSGAFKRATPTAASSKGAQTKGHASAARMVQGASRTTETLLAPITTLILYRCPALDVKAEEWLKTKVPTFAHIQLDRQSKQRVETGSRKVNPW
ncbi:hypothetical protein OC835_004270 [Tilletia horrida]|nr:hypothetical protein OC835_004270 [Tilletia horrida]